MGVGGERVSDWLGVCSRTNVPAHAHAYSIALTHSALFQVREGASDLKIFLKELDPVYSFPTPLLDGFSTYLARMWMYVATRNKKKNTENHFALKFS